MGVFRALIISNDKQYTKRGVVEPSEIVQIRDGVGSEGGGGSLIQ